MVKDHHKDFYQEKSKKFKRYLFSSNSKIIKGKTPDFFKLIKKYSNPNFILLDIGCGSGELTIKLSHLFKSIVGIDVCIDYINSANALKEHKNITNVKFQVANGTKLPFEDGKFDIVMSSRGPLSARLDFISEANRMLKKGGCFIEETIGEDDKQELKQIFGRGQNYPPKNKLEKVKKLLDEIKTKLIYHKYFKYYSAFPNIDSVIEILERAPIIPEFSPKRDKAHLEEVVNKLSCEEGIVLSSHRLHWVAQK